MLKKIIKKIAAKAGIKMFPQATIGITTRQLRTFMYLSRLYPLVHNLPGDIVECGVGRGRTFLYFSYLAFQEKKNRHVWGFDSFQGFPEPRPEDISERNPKKGEWAGMTPDSIRAILTTAGISKDFVASNITLVPGFFEKTLHKYNKKPIAILHVDADLYESYRDVLRDLFPYVVKGGIVLFDEYNSPLWPGAKQATDEFLVKHPHEIQHDPIGGKYYFIKK